MINDCSTGFWRTVAVVFCLCIASSGAGAQLVEGQDYRLVQPHSTLRPARIEVVEFFFYGCRSCYLLEPVLRDWAQRNANDIVFRRVPAMRRKAWQPLGELFYALAMKSLLPQLHDEVYRAIHEQGLRLGSRSEQLRWISTQGVDSHAFADLFDSDDIAIEIQKARDQTIAYDVRVTPSIVVDGRFMTTGAMLRNAGRVDMVMDQLVAMAKEARAGLMR